MSSSSGAYALLQAASLFILVRGFGDDATGRYLACQAVATPLAVICALRLRDTLSTSPEPRSLAPMLPLLAIASGVAAAIGLAGTWVVGVSDADRSLFAAVLVTNLAQQSAFAAAGVHFRRRAVRIPAGSLIVQGIVNLGALSLGAHLDRLLVGVWLAAGLTVVIALADLWYATRVSRTHARVDVTLRGFVAPQLHLSSSEAVGLVQLTGVRLVIAGGLGTTSLAVFGTISSFLRIFQPVINAIARVSAPEVAQSVADGDHPALSVYLKRLLTLAAIATPIAAVVGSLAIAPVLGVVLGDAYGEDRVLVALVTMTAVPLFLLTVQSNVLLALRLVRAVQLSTYTGAAIALIGSAATEGTWGLRAAGVSMFIATAARLLVGHTFAARHLDQQVPSIPQGAPC